jgi:hypothetical protein
MRPEPQITFLDTPRSEAVETLIREDVEKLDTFYEGNQYEVGIILAVAGSNIVVNRTRDQRTNTDRLRVHAHVIPVDEGRDHCA